MAEIAERMVVSCSGPVLSEILAHRPGDWLRPFLRIAGHEGDQVGTRLRATLGRGPLGPVSMTKAVAVTLGEPDPEAEEGVTSIPIRWDAAGYRSLFPVFEGRLILRALSETETEVSIEGRYDPPGWLVGDVVDRLVAHRAAEASVRNLLANLRTAVEEAVGTRGASAGGSPRAQ